MSTASSSATSGRRGCWARAADEDDGGTGLGATHATVVFEELGRGLVPGPVVATHLAAGLVEGAVDGSTILADHERGDGRLRHPTGIDGVVVVDDHGLALHTDVAAPLVARPFDPLTGIAVVEHEWSAGEPLGGPEDAAAWRPRRTLLTCAQLLGAAAGATDLAVQYAGQREQFGRTIGSFQSVKHLCADSLTPTEVARAAVYAAACHLDGRTDDDTPDGVDLALSTAAVLASEAAVDNAKTCIQVHGGMGFTWEVDAHLYLKRATVWAATVGGALTHGERLAAALAGP